MLVPREPPLDKRKNRGVVANRMRHVSRSREWRDNYKGHPDAILIEAVDALFSGQSLRAKQLLVIRAVGALRTITENLGVGRVGEIRAFSRRNAVRRDRGRRGDVIVETTMLVVGPDNYRVAPVRSAADRVDYVGHRRFPGPDVVWRMFTILQAEVHECHRRQVARGRLRHELIESLKMGRDWIVYQT